MTFANLLMRCKISLFRVSRISLSLSCGSHLKTASEILQMRFFFFLAPPLPHRFFWNARFCPRGSGFQKITTHTSELRLYTKDLTPTFESDASSFFTTVYSVLYGKTDAI